MALRERRFENDPRQSVFILGTRSDLPKASLDHEQEHDHAAQIDFHHHPVLASLSSPGSASPRSRAIRGGRGS